MVWFKRGVPPYHNRIHGCGDGPSLVVSTTDSVSRQSIEDFGVHNLCNNVETHRMDSAPPRANLHKVILV